MTIRTRIHRPQVFDGTTVIGERDVLIADDGKITVEGPTEFAGADGAVDGTGCMLMPGLIDAHAHLWSDEARAESAAFGVTTSLDMFSPPGATLPRTEWVPVADARTAAWPATAPGGHGTEYGIGIPVVSGDTDPDQFVASQIRNGAAYIKVIVDHSRGAGALPEPTIRAITAAAHQHGLLALAHIALAEDAVIAIECGVDALMHCPIDDATTVLTGAPGIMVPTLTTLHAGFNPDVAPLLDDERVTRWLTRDALQGLESFWQLPNWWTWHGVLGNVAAAHAAGWRILAGTDASMPATAHGASLHHELELLVDAGLTPTEALRAATSATAETFSLDDRGRVVAGARADLVLVRGDAATDVTTSRNIEGVWANGQRFDHAAWRERIILHDEHLHHRPTIPHRARTAIPNPAARVHVVTDQEHGGTSTASAQNIGNGAARITAVVREQAFGIASAGLTWVLSTDDDGINLSDTVGLRISATSPTPVTLAVAIDSGNPIRQPQTATVLIGHEPVTLPWASIAQVDLERVRTISFLTTQPGEHEITYDGIAVIESLEEIHLVEGSTS